MDAARLSIGYALFWYPRDVAETLGTAQVASLFWSHRVDAYVKLSMASDRLRDFLIMAATRGPRRPFKNRYEDSGTKSAADMPWKWYATPFTSIVELLGEKVTFVQQRCASAINAVREAGCLIRAYKKDRNIVMHELATKMAEVTRDLHVMAEKRAVEGEKPKITSTVGDFHEMSIDIKNAGIRAMREFAEATGALKDWYALLLATSHHVFQIDYHTRIHDGSGN